MGKSIINTIFAPAFSSSELCTIAGIDSGEKVEAIAADHDCSAATVSRIAREAGRPARRALRRSDGCFAHEGDEMSPVIETTDWAASPGEEHGGFV